ncbi:hypothetical protein [Aliiroseovarius sp. 2305UL8-7]|uniref:phosphoribosyltransferase-like protein n=1 Tax=Aliiroseovarius conchicola TaxID=3121637 RepID=UPI003526C6BD
MNQDLALKVMGEIMRWDDDEARKEFRWLKLMARLKYDGYRDFQAGMRFIESLATWLQQFDQDERKVAYTFVKERMVYVGPGEVRRLVEQFFPNTIRQRIVKTVADDLGIKPYTVLTDPKAISAIERLRRQTLVLGLSDGARMDIVRHSNVGRLSNEQLVLAPQIDTEKWKDLLESLREDLKDQDALFRIIYLVDDFAGTGTSFLRFNDKKKKWSGKLTRFRTSLFNAIKDEDVGNIVSPDWQLCAHHYMATSDAKAKMTDSELAARKSMKGDGWPKEVHLSFATVFDEKLPIVPGKDDAFIALANKYYDPIIETKHTAVGGVQHLGLGYGGCALPVVLEHNTPNNSAALLWAETSGGDREGVDVPAMRPLFRRRQRHV